MQITNTHLTEKSEAPQLRSNWWLVPSFVCGAAIWVLIITALIW